MKLNDIREEIDLLYRAIGDPQYLDVLLTLIRRKTRSCSGSIQVDNYQTMEVIGGVFQGFSDKSIELYQQYYSKVNVLTNAASVDQRLFDRIFISDQLLSLRQFKASEFYVDWVKPYIGTDYSIWMTLNDDREQMIKLTLQRFANEQSYSDDNTHQYLALLRPHLRAAMKSIQFSLGSSRLNLHYLDHSGVLLDNKSKVVSTNKHFDDLLDDQSWLKMDSEGMLKLPPKALHWLQQNLYTQHQLQTPVIENEHFFSSENADEYLLKLTPFIQEDNSLLRNIQPRMSLLTIKSQRRELDLAELRRLYGLTKTEAYTVKLLFQGASLVQISSQTERTLHTVRSLMKIVFKKMLVSSQSELVIKVAASSAYY
jgi:DNA-binding CsgD family transcriptional regulator